MRGREGERGVVGECEEEEGRTELVNIVYICCLMFYNPPREEAIRSVKVILMYVLGSRQVREREELRSGIN